MNYFSMNHKELQAEYEVVQKEYAAFQQMNLSLDMSRGKPGADQLDMAGFFVEDSGISP